MKISLKVDLANGETFTSEYDEASISVGRSPDSDLRLGSVSQQMVSWEHLSIEEDPLGGIQLKDLGSTNGVYVNDARVDTQRYVELLEKDVLRFGYSSREYVILNADSATT